MDLFDLLIFEINGEPKNVDANSTLSSLLKMKLQEKFIVMRTCHYDPHAEEMLFGNEGFNSHSEAEQKIRDWVEQLDNDHYDYWIRQVFQPV